VDRASSSATAFTTLPLVKFVLRVPLPSPLAQPTTPALTHRPRQSRPYRLPLAVSTARPPPVTSQPRSLKQLCHHHLSLHPRRTLGSQVHIGILSRRLLCLLGVRAPCLQVTIVSEEVVILAVLDWVYRCQRR